MPKSYTPGLKILNNTIVYKKRILPISGNVHVNKNDKVNYDTIVASAEIPGNVQMLNVANELNIDPEQVPDCMLCKINEKVSKNQIIAKSKGLFGFFKTDIKSPVDGIIGNISDITGQVIISEKSEKIDIDAYLPGLVDDVVVSEGVVVKSIGTFIQGIIGIGGEKKGKLNISDLGPNIPHFKDLKKYENQIIVINGHLKYNFYELASKAGILGIVCGGVDYSTISKILGYPLGVAITGTEDVTTVIVTEGFGDIRMSDKTFNMLKNNVGKNVSINGATQIRAGVLRPEIFIGDNQSNSNVENFNEEKLIISIGSKVRIIRQPYFGTIGKVVELPKELVKMDTETNLRVAIVEFDDNRKVVIPRANLEVILSD
tara:strand:+ start:2950 stop:4068 length:1119 start_codon:yes stop_codon:yes gene_type:complete